MRTTFQLAVLTAVLAASTLAGAEVKYGGGPIGAIPEAKIKLPGIFSSHMVLQRDMAVPIWGWAPAGEKVTVIFADQTKEATADPNGKWMVKLDPMKAGGPFELKVAAAGAEETLEDILVGEVWFCSGQSNMQFPVDDVNDANAEVAAADFPQIRLLIVPCKAFDEPQSNCGGKWAVCSPQTIHRFSAAGYFFGRELHKTLGVPVGLVDSSWGGTTAEAWTSRAVLQGDDDLAKLFTNYQEIVANWDPNKAQAEYERKMAVWKVEVEKAKAEGTKLPREPYKPFSPAMAPGPAKLYNGMVAPVIPLAIRGAIWYQGESNADRPDQYARLLPAMIRNWRADWGQGDFSFYIVQLANYREIKEKPSDSEWPRLREAQLKTMQTVPNTGMAVIIDVGAADDIHPKDKQTVGQRLALWAMAKDYGKDVVFSGPVFKSMEKQDGKCVLSFDYADGLTAKGGEELKGFAIAGEGKKFVWAEVKIEGDKVVVWSEQVPDPVAVRYAWANNPVCNLYNAADLPACPFRTDDWPMPVKEKKPKKTDSQPTQSATQPATQPASN